MERPTGQLDWTAKTRKVKRRNFPRHFDSPRIAAVGGGLGSLDSESPLEGGGTGGLCV